jgi:putative inorganic carbon (HCO3(-)) transporter
MALAALYVWVDTFRPQDVALIILNELPVAMIMGGGAILSYFALDRRSPPPLTLQSSLQIMFAIWMTASFMWAELPERAYEKWDWAFKSIAFAAFLPLVIRSRVQIEAFAQTYVFSLAANFVPFGIKVLISGGGYGQNLGLLNGNAGLAEGGYLSTVCLMAVPMALYLGKHGQLIPRLPMMPLAYGGVAALAVITALGTFERSAVVGLFVLGLYMFMRSRRKFMFVAIGGVAVVAIVVATAGSWSERMSTVGQFKTESSAVVRLLVWQWTFDYSLTHPLGGGLNSYLINTIVLPGDDSNPGGTVQNARAFHSIYFEVLGELGWPGLFMFLLTGMSSVFSLRNLAKKCRKNPDLAWVADMSDAVQAGIMVFLSAGAFVGIAFQPPFWYFVSMGICLRAYVWHAERIEATPVAGWRRAARASAMEAAQGWRKPRPLPAGVGAGAGTGGPLRAPDWRGAAQVRGDGQRPGFRT